MHERCISTSKSPPDCSIFLFIWNVHLSWYGFCRFGHVRYLFWLSGCACWMTREKWFDSHNAREQLLLLKCFHWFQGRFNMLPLLHCTLNLMVSLYFILWRWYFLQKTFHFFPHNPPKEVALFEDNLIYKQRQLLSFVPLTMSAGGQQLSAFGERLIWL